MTAPPANPATNPPVTLDRLAGGVARIVIDSPPVNALGHAVRAGLWQAVDQAEADPQVRIILIAAAGRTFPAGADIREFGQPPADPLLPDLCNRIEGCAKPVVAALHGTVLGGGLELALAAHYRIADPAARLGFPEITLGLLPGAGGTQRAPRLIGAEAALQMMLTGKPIPAAQAGALLDRLATGDLATDALAYAQELADTGAPPRPTCDRADGMADPDAFAAAVAAARDRIGNNPDLPAPSHIVDCVAAVPRLPFTAGLGLERAAFLACRDSAASAGLRHAFLAERRAAHVPESDAAPRAVDHVGIVGGGLMGAGIAVACLTAGQRVTLAERDAGAADKAAARVADLIRRAVTRGRATEAQAADRLARFAAVVGADGLAPVDLAIEAVFEDFDAKAAVFADLDAVLRPGAVLATNTSYLDIDALAATTARPGDVIGLHFFSPAHVMRLLEVVPGARTDPGVVATGFALAKRLGKIAVRAGNADGFIGNRILAAYRTATDFLLEDGATPAQIDAAMRDFGMAMGPYEVLDMAGLEISWARRKRLAATRNPAERYVRIGDLLCEARRFGQKTGRGYYRHDGGKPVEDTEVLDLIAAERARKGIAPRDIGASEIQRRALAAMANEGARLLAGGIALRPSDIDVVLLAGYGFPRWRGGPMKAADMAGLPGLLDDLTRWAGAEGTFWTPAPLIADLVAQGRGFDDLNGAGGAEKA